MAVMLQVALISFLELEIWKQAETHILQVLAGVALVEIGRPNSIG